MAISTLSKGYQKPSNPTTGDAFFPAMEDNIQLMNDHVHDGVTGAINPAASATISSGAWGVADANGIYTQEITLPVGRTFDTTILNFRTSTGEVIYPKVAKSATNKFNVYTNDNTVGFVVLYG